MKIFDLLLEPHLDFFRFPKHKSVCVCVGGGGGEGVIPRPGYLHPHPVFLTCNAICYLDRQTKQIILWNY